MKILGVETSSSICSVALLEDGKLLKELELQDAKTHSVNLLPLLQSLLKECNSSLQDIDLFACSIGPRFFYRN